MDDYKNVYITGNFYILTRNKFFICQAASFRLWFCNKITQAEMVESKMYIYNREIFACLVAV